MWNQSGFGAGGGGGGGGFLDSPSQLINTPTGGSGPAKKQRAQNIVPVQIGDILQSQDEQLKVEGQEVGMVVLVGQVRGIDQQSTKTVYKIEDDTGTLEAVHWSDDTSDSASSGVAAAENTFCRIVGSVRTAQEKKHIMVFRISQVDATEEIEAHALEVVHARMLIRRTQDKENSAIGGNAKAAGGLSNSMMTGSYSAAGGDFGGSSANSFGNAKQDAVYKLIGACLRDEGLNRDEIFTQLKGRMNKAELDNCLDFLSGEGHIYSTIDDDHFKTTDA